MSDRQGTVSDGINLLVASTADGQNCPSYKRLSSCQALLNVVAVLLLLFVAQEPAIAHAAENLLFNSLVEKGITISADNSVRLPRPILADGLGPAQQRQAIEAIVGGKYDWATFTRKSVVAPFVLKISDDDAGSDPVGRQVDVYLVAYGKLETLDNEEFLQKQLNLAGEDSDPDDEVRVKLLTSDELEKRGIAAAAPAAAADSRWIATTSALLGKVRVSVTTKNTKTSTAESVLVASVTDPHFNADAELPNSWQAITVNDAGRRQIGERQTYASLGSYVKATRLAEPAGALLVEYHVAFGEPYGWFHGTNLLRSKLPIVAQDMVRKLRRSLAEEK